jgi:hypothetical protein
MTRSTRNSANSDDNSSPALMIDQQLTNLSTIMNDIHTRLAHQDSYNASHDSRINSQDSCLEA